MAAEQPGLLVIVAPTGFGGTRFAAELAEALAADGAVLVRARGSGKLAQRLANGLRDAELRPDPLASLALRPYVALLGDLDAEQLAEAERIAAPLIDTPALLIACSTEVPTRGADLQLGPVDAETATEIVVATAPNLDPMGAARIVRAGDGRPGVLVALARANRRLPYNEPLRIPALLAVPIDARIGELPPDDLDLLRWIAVIGDPSGPNLLVRLAARSAEAVTRSLDNLIDTGLVAERRTEGDLTVSVQDPLTLEAVRQSIAPNDRRRRNRAVLGARRALGDGADDLVQHAIGSADSDEVVGLSLRAASTARTNHDHVGALEHATRALAWLPRGSDRHVDALLEQGLATAGIGAWQEATEILRDVVRLKRRVGDEAGAMQAVTEWARMRWYAGFRREAFDVLTSNIPEGDLPSAARVNALNQAAMFASGAGQHSQALAWAQRARDEALGVDDPLAAAMALSTVGLARLRSVANPDALEDFRAAYAETQALDNPRQSAIVLNNHCYSLLMLGCPQAAADRAQMALDLVEARGVAELDAPLTHNLAEALTALGRFRDARRAVRRSQAAYKAIGAGPPQALDAILAWIDFAEGRVPEALSGIRAVALNTDENDVTELMGTLAAAHVHIANAAGELDEARENARKAIRFWEETDDRLDSLALYGAACEVLPASEAKHIRAEIAVAADAGAPHAQALVPYAEAWAARGATAAAAAFNEAADRFTDAGFMWWAARCRMLAGERAPKQAGVDDLLEARRLFRQLEAPGWRSRCEAELRARGHKFVMASRHRDESDLTEREVEVLRLVALGLQNRDIADRLYISERTAGRHLERIFDKLNVVGRGGAVGMGVELGLVTEVADQVAEDINSGGSGAFSGVNNA